MTGRPLPSFPHAACVVRTSNALHTKLVLLSVLMSRSLNGILAHTTFYRPVDIQQKPVYASGLRSEVPRKEFHPAEPANSQTLQTAASVSPTQPNDL